MPYGDPDQVAQVDTDGDGSGDQAYTVADWLSGRGLPGNYASPPGGADDDNAVVSGGGLHNTALDERPPASSLYHELAHYFDQIRGGTPDGEYTEVQVDHAGNELVRNDDVPQAELNSVGNDLDGDGDIDTVETDGGDEHPWELTENALRDDLGLDRRPSYTLVPGPGETILFDGYDD